jgi:hypothetical protein
VVEQRRLNVHSPRQRHRRGLEDVEHVVTRLHGT